MKSGDITISESIFGDFTLTSAPKTKVQPCAVFGIRTIFRKKEKCTPDSKSCFFLYAIVTVVVLSIVIKMNYPKQKEDKYYQKTHDFFLFGASIFLGVMIDMIANSMTEWKKTGIQQLGGNMADEVLLINICTKTNIRNSVELFCQNSATLIRH